MKELIKEKDDAGRMADLALSMLKSTFEGLMKHDLDSLGRVLKDEDRLNEMESALTVSLIETAKGKVGKTDKNNIILLTDIVADLEQVGDYIKDMVERIEIKIQDKLLFSEDALAEYKHLYLVVEAALSDTVNSLKMGDKNFARRLLRDREHVDGLVKKYRNAHTKRLMAGICDPRACNMYLNLLDFTGQIFHHSQAIAKNILKLK